MSYRLATSVALLALACLPASACADRPVRLTAGFGSGAKLGGKAPLHFGLEVDDRQIRFAATEIRLFAPAGIDIGSLGVATCSVPPATLVDVVLPRTPEVPCPRNSVIGQGTATAALLFHPEVPPIRGATADITLYSGPVQEDRPGLLVMARTSNPATMQLAYAGRLSPASRPFGLEFALRIPAPAEPPFGAVIGLLRIRVTIGGEDLVYTRQVRGKRRYYPAGGVGIPSRCPRGGLPFRAELRFSDGSQRAAEVRARCPSVPRRQAARE